MPHKASSPRVTVIMSKDGLSSDGSSSTSSDIDDAQSDLSAIDLSICDSDISQNSELESEYCQLCDSSSSSSLEFERNICAASSPIVMEETGIPSESNVETDLTHTDTKDSKTEDHQIDNITTSPLTLQSTSP